MKKRTAPAGVFAGLAMAGIFAALILSCNGFFAPRPLAEEGPVVKRPALSLRLEPASGAVRGVKTVDVGAGNAGDAVLPAAVTINTADLRADLEKILELCGMDMGGYAGLPAPADKANYISSAATLFSETPGSGSLPGSGQVFTGVNPYVYEIAAQKKVDRYWGAGWGVITDPDASAQKYIDEKAGRWVKYAAFVGLNISAWDDPLTANTVETSPDTGNPAHDVLNLPLIPALQPTDHELLSTPVYDNYRTSLNGISRIADYYAASYTGDWTGANDDDRNVIIAALDRLRDVAEQFYLGVYPTSSSQVDIQPGLAINN